MADKCDVLFVDDEESVLKSMQRLCRKEPWSIKTAIGGEEALALLEETQIALIVSDMRMPGMDGAELLGEVTKKYPQVKQILLTGYSDIDSTVKAINNARISHYIAKPWDNDHLRRVITDALDEHRLREEYTALVALTEQQNEQLKELNDELEEKVAVRTKALRHVVNKLDKANAVLKSSYASFVRVFSQFIELRDPRLSPSVAIVSAHVRLIAEKMQLDSEMVDQLSFAAMLRNLGKLTLPDDVLGMSFEEMDAEKKMAYRRYPEIGQTLLLSIENLQEAANIIGAHQERINGKGYPHNLDSDEISLPAQILGIVGDYHDLINGVLTSARRSPQQIRDYLDSQRDKRYCSDIVGYYFEVLDHCEADDRTHEQENISSAKLQPEMVLSQDLITPSGLFLIAKDSVLTEKTIEKIIRFESDDDEPFIIHVYRYSMPTQQ